jgi:mono/diheme cytochrome c family protein
MRLVAWVAAALCILLAPAAGAQTRSGAELYEWACAACHGHDGRGQPRSRVGFETPLPDFTDCGFATPEPDADWATIVQRGGPVRAFDRRMPAFGEVLSPDEIQRVLGHVRSFCVRPRAWPRGELNLPRALVTEKAFPENEAVFTVAATGGNEFASEVLYEHRLGARSQFELALPFEAHESDSNWNQGLGDMAVAFKHVLHHNLARGSIFSAAAEVTLPTGSESRGLGSGLTVFEPFAAYGQILPRDSFLHLQAGIELPSDPDRADKEAFWRAAFGKSFLEHGFGRAWSPMVEVLGARELVSGAETEWDIVPQMQVTLSRRQHIMVSAGIRQPVNAREERGRAFLTYLLWDWFDGGFFDGWR